MRVSYIRVLAPACADESINSRDSRLPLKDYQPAKHGLENAVIYFSYLETESQRVLLKSSISSIYLCLVYVGCFLSILQYCMYFSSFLKYITAR